MWYKLEYDCNQGGFGMAGIELSLREERKRPGRKKGSYSKRWKKDEFDFIMEYIDMMTIEEIAFILKREYSSVCIKIIDLNREHGQLVELTTQEKLDLKMIFKAFGLTRNDLREEKIQDYEIELICKRFKKFDYVTVRNLIDKSLKTNLPLPIRRERIKKVPSKEKIKTLYMLEENYYGAYPARVNI